MQILPDSRCPARPSRRRRGLFRDRRGVIAIVLGLVALPLIGIVGLAVDYGFATRAQALLNSAADSAAVAATDAASNAFVNNVTNFSAPAVAAGTQVFTAQAVGIPSVTVQPVTVTVTQTPGSATFVSVVNYTASYKTWFGVLFGVPAFPIAGGATAQITLKAFEDFHILMDVSGSMEIASTPANMALLGPLTLSASTLAASNTRPYNTQYNGSTSYMPAAAQGTNCAFACHWDNSGQPGINDFYELAKQQGIPVRLDVELAAVSTVITTMSGQDANSQYRVAVYTFANSLTTVYPLSTNLISGATAAANVQEPYQNQNNEPDTNFGAAMTSLATIIPTPGDGSTSAAPQEFLIVITDGIEDYNAAGCNNPSGRCQQPITPSECAALKAEGVQILVVYVQYYPLDVAPYSNGWYIAYIQQYVDPSNGSTTDTVPTNLQACASSSSFYFYAADGSGIEQALEAALQAAENQGVRLVR